MNTSDVVRSARRHWALVLLILALTGAVVLGFLLNREVVTPAPRYRTSIDLLIPAVNPQTNNAPSNVPPVLLHGQVELANSVAVTANAFKGVGVNPSDRRNFRLDARLSASQEVMSMTVTGPTPESAKNVDESYARAYLVARRDSVAVASERTAASEQRFTQLLYTSIAQLDAELTSQGVALPPTVTTGSPLPLPPGLTQEQILDLYTRNASINQLNARQIRYGSLATNVTVASTFGTEVQTRQPSRVTPPPPSPTVPLLAIFGIGLALALAAPALLDRFDGSIRSPAVAAQLFNAPVLATLPPVSRFDRHGWAPPGSDRERAFRALAATSVSTDHVPKALLVTSPTGSVQGNVSANYAAALAWLGLNVALVGTLSDHDWFVSPIEDDGESGLDADESHDPGATDAADERPRRQRRGWRFWRRPPEDATDEGGERGEAGGESSPADGESTPAADGGAEVDTTAEVPAIQPDRDPERLPDVLNMAAAGTLGPDVRDHFTPGPFHNLLILPPGNDETELNLDGLPPLLEAVQASGIDVTIIAGPALLEDPDAIIMAWTTRSILWAIQAGSTGAKDAQEAAERFELAGGVPFGIAFLGAEN